MDEEKDAAYPCGVNSLFSKGKGQSLVFSHNEHSEFPLDDIHVNLQCSSCHTISEQVVYRPLATTCAECHSEFANYFKWETTWVAVNPDPHAGRVAGTAYCSPADDSHAGIVGSGASGAEIELAGRLFGQWVVRWGKMSIINGFCAEKYIFSRKGLVGNGEEAATSDRRGESMCLDGV